MKYNVFVYGTLKRGFCNNVLLNDATFLGEAETINRMTMLSLGGFPMLVDSYGVSIIHGEVYEVDDDTLQELDNLEGHPNFYMRKTTNVSINGGKAVKAITYLKGKHYRPYGSAIVLSGAWTKERT